ncbi:2-oxoglutarate dehydrogenase, E2 component, dihydrolipoamide succinyltransferase [Leucobacter sp. 1207-22]|uniref:2-oxoglutarate dehydrogenase, E2 component, dihydrolipoamide succinyltransferase n=1 Tax=Leucobacter sp. 1207-22 TaxID=2604456 RepID=UPI00406474EE
MSESVVLPALGESVTEGTVTRWLKNVGDTVAVDEPLLEVSTDKVDTEIPSPVAGVIEEILVQEDETAEVGAVLVRIGDGSGAAAPAAPVASPVAAPAAPVAPAAPAAPAPAAAPAGADAQDIVLPSLGESITEGTVTRWLKAIGDTVAVDEPLLEVSTDKVDTEVPSSVAGVLQEILVQEDESVEVGAVLARVGSGAVAPAAPAAPVAPAAVVTPAAPAAAAAAPAAPAAAPQPAAPAPAAPASNPNYVTPIVRKLASDLNVNLESVTGTGVGGRIRKEDVIAAAPKPAATPAPAAAPAVAAAAAAHEVSDLRGTRQKMSRLRKVIAERAVASLQATAQLTTMVEVDVTRVAKLRQAKKDEFLQKTGNKLSFMPFFAIAAAEALQSYPIINSTVEDNEIVYPSTENIAIAVDTERGLLTPVLRDAGAKNISQIAADIADLAARTRDNKLTPDELSGGTFTLTNTGSRGALFDTPLVFLPQSAILGTGAVVKKPGVVSTPEGDAIAIRSMVYLALSYDHRTIDGADAARFLSQMKQRLEAGNFENDLGI